MLTHGGSEAGSEEEQHPARSSLSAQVEQAGPQSSRPPARGSHSRCRAARMSAEEMEAEELMPAPEAVRKETSGYLLPSKTEATPSLLQNPEDPAS